MKPKEMTITSLGTVSPYCKKNKNCPAFLVEENGNRILLDCGSGITSLMNIPKDLQNLIIILSHLHKDHYSDILSIGYASYVYKKLGELNKKIPVYMPNEDKEIEDYLYLTNFGEEHELDFISYSDKSNLKHGNTEISFARNPHQLCTYSTKITSEAGTLIYSSDTGFEKSSIPTFAKDADILICESTFLKGQSKENDNHLYAYQAALLAKKANVKKLVLTHFWPEIDKQKYVNEAREIFENTIAAEEGEQIILRRKL